MAKAKQVFTSLVFVQGEFRNADGFEIDYSAATGGAFIYPSVNAEGAKESATRHAAILHASRRIAILDAETFAPILDADGNPTYKPLESCVVQFATPIPKARHYGSEAIAAFLKGREWEPLGKMPSALAAVRATLKRQAASEARKAAKAAEVMPIDAVEETAEVK